MNEYLWYGETGCEKILVENFHRKGMTDLINKIGHYDSNQHQKYLQALKNNPEKEQVYRLVLLACYVMHQCCFNVVRADSACFEVDNPVRTIQVERICIKTIEVSYHGGVF